MQRPALCFGRPPVVLVAHAPGPRWRPAACSIFQRSRLGGFFLRRLTSPRRFACASPRVPAICLSLAAISSASAVPALVGSPPTLPTAGEQGCVAVALAPPWFHRGGAFAFVPLTNLLVPYKPVRWLLAGVGTLLVVAARGRKIESREVTHQNHHPPHPHRFTSTAVGFARLHLRFHPRCVPIWICCAAFDFSLAAPSWRLQQTPVTVSVVARYGSFERVLVCGSAPSGVRH